MSDEREFGPDDDLRDDDDAPAAETPRGRRIVWFSRTVTRNGEGITVDEVLSVDGYDDDEPEPPLIGGPGRCKMCDRPIPPGAWWCSLEHEYFWTRAWSNMVRNIRSQGGTWRADRPWDIGRKWTCAACHRPIEDVKSKGRTPLYCARPDCIRDRGRERQGRHRNAGSK